MSAMRHILLLAICTFAFANMLQPQHACADGKFFGRASVAAEPGVAAQRAFIAFRDGKQTLVVQSDIDNAGESVGWLLPLPANPTAIEAAPTHCLRPLGDMFRPKFVTRRSGVLIPALGLFAVVAILSLQQLWLKTSNKPNRMQRALSTFGLLFAAFLVLSFMFPSLSSSRALKANAAVELQSKQAGVYDVTVIAGDSVEAINTWLQENGFRSHARADAVIKDYLRDGWCFLAAQVRSDINGAVTQHPLHIEFPTQQPIYPMRLTGTDDIGIRLDLFVVADQQAAASHMTAWYCDVMQQRDNYVGLTRDIDIQIETPPVFQAKRHRRHHRVALPTVTDAMWNGCVLTHLHGRFSPSQMREDVLIEQVPTQPGIATVHAPKAAWQIGGSYGALMGTLACLLFAVRAERRSMKWQTFLKRHVPLSMALGGVLAGTVYLRLEVVPVEITKEPRFLAQLKANDHWHAIEALAEEPDAADFIATYKQHLRTSRVDQHRQVAGRNKLDAPGDYLVEKTETGWQLSFVDGSFTPVTVPFGEDGRPIRTDSARAANDSNATLKQ